MRTYLSLWVVMCCSQGIAQPAHFRQVAGHRVQQGWIELEEVGSQVVIPYVIFWDHAWLPVVALSNLGFVDSLSTEQVPLCAPLLRSAHSQIGYSAFT